MSTFTSCQQCGTIHIKGAMCPHCFGPKHPYQYSYPHHPLSFGDSRWFDAGEVKYTVEQLQSKVEAIQNNFYAMRSGLYALIKGDAAAWLKANGEPQVPEGTVLGHFSIRDRVAMRALEKGEGK